MNFKIGDRVKCVNKLHPKATYHSAAWLEGKSFVIKDIKDSAGYKYVIGDGRFLSGVFFYELELDKLFHCNI